MRHGSCLYFYTYMKAPAWLWSLWRVSWASDPVGAWDMLANLVAEA